MNELSLITSIFIAMLSSPQYKIRESATAQLTKYCCDSDQYHIFEYLSVSYPDPEVRLRLSKVVSEYFSPRPTIKGFKKDVPLLECYDAADDDKDYNTIFNNYFHCVDCEWSPLKGYYLTTYKLTSEDKEYSRIATQEYIYHLIKRGWSRKKIINILNKMAENELKGKTFLTTYSDTYYYYNRGYGKLIR